MDFLDTRLEDTAFSTRDILNFLYTGPEYKREAGMADFDWRNVFNLVDPLIRTFNQYSEVRFPLPSLPPHSWLGTQAVLTCCLESDSPIHFFVSL